MFCCDRHELKMPEGKHRASRCLRKQEILSWEVCSSATGFLFLQGSCLWQSHCPQFPPHTSFFIQDVSLHSFLFKCTRPLSLFRGAPCSQWFGVQTSVPLPFEAFSCLWVTTLSDSFRVKLRGLLLSLENDCHSCLWRIGILKKILFCNTAYCQHNNSPLKRWISEWRWAMKRQVDEEEAFTATEKNGLCWFSSNS